MMRQYLDVKSQVPDAILFFRLGDFYEMFFDDALEASKLLDITLTSRSKGADRVPMCGVPYHAAKGYIARLVAAGKRVAICDQVDPAREGEKPGAKMMRRELSRIVTPGMAVDDELLDPPLDSPGRGARPRRARGWASRSSIFRPASSRRLRWRARGSSSRSCGDSCPVS